MPDITPRLREIARGLGTFEGEARLILFICAIVTLAAVARSFLRAKKAEAVNSETRSPVATATMLVFFAGFYCILRFRVGEAPAPSTLLLVASQGVGLVLVIIGTVVNVIGRVALAGNWGDHIRIYHDHTFVTTGMYAWVRHPLYASLIWMFFGAALVFQNWLALAANLCLFFPAMYYRARQEECALQARFPEYAEYRRRVGMFLPKP